MRKAEALKRWKELDEDQNYVKHMKPIPYKHRGTKYGACGLRIEGNPDFVDAVLSRLKDLLAGENDITRLGLSWKKVEPREDKENDFANGKNEVCYIRLHMRGEQAQQANTMFGMQQDETRKFADLIDA